MSRARQRLDLRPPTSLPVLDVQLGDGADTLAITGSLWAPTALDAGAGDDTLTGGTDADLLDGGLGADRLDGGAGLDRLTFAERTDGVSVDVPARRTSDGDTLAGLEHFQGGEGADRLLGGPRADELSGGGGADTLRGAGGDDKLAGDLGRTSSKAGPARTRSSAIPRRATTTTRSVSPSCATSCAGGGATT